MSPAITSLRPRQWLLLLLSPVLLWPAMVNGGAFYFQDTTACIRGVDQALHKAVGWRSVWTEPEATPDRAASPTPAPAPRDKPVLPAVRYSTA